MALIFSPLTEDILDGPFKPYPRSAFLMLQDNQGTAEIDKKIDTTVCNILDDDNFATLKATTKRQTKDYLEKIVQLIRGCGFGLAMFSEYTNKTSLANIFFEIGLCNMLGKPVVIIKTEGAVAPSDFVRTEWVTFIDDKDRFEKDFKKSVESIKELSEYYEKLGDIAYEAEEKDFELAFERYKQAFLISSNGKVKRKIVDLLGNMDQTPKTSRGLKISRRRLRTSMIEFSKLI